LFAAGVLSALVSVLFLVPGWLGPIVGAGLGAAIAIGGLGLLAVVAVARIASSEEMLDALFIVGFLCLLLRARNAINPCIPRGRSTRA
jgi:hypothetical protein